MKVVRNPTPQIAIGSTYRGVAGGKPPRSGRFIGVGLYVMVVGIKGNTIFYRYLPTTEAYVPIGEYYQSRDSFLKECVLFYTPKPIT